MRTCPKCRESKPLSEFYDRPKQSYCRACTRLINLAWRAKHPERKLAHSRVASALKLGELTRPSACSQCGAEQTPVAHHKNYARPLDVVWLCDPCHSQAHIALRQREERKAAAANYHARKAAQLLGRKGGSVKSERKTIAVRENGKLGGGRPKTASPAGRRSDRPGRRSAVPES